MIPAIACLLSGWEFGFYLLDLILKEGDVKSLELRKIQLLTFHELILEDRLNINHLFILVLVLFIRNSKISPSL